MTSSFTPSRRAVLKGAAIAAASAGSSVFRPFDAQAAAAPAYRGIFGYGVASGDPTADAVVIWTRATPPQRRRSDEVATPGSGLGAPLRVRWEVARDRDFQQVVDRGYVVTSAQSDHTVKVDVRGLRPYTRYFYRFRAAGDTSPIGRTQTAPDERHRTHALRFGLVSCSNYTGGYFGAYRALSERNDLDFVLHVGDYLYEYGNGADRYGPADLIGKRDSIPATETIDLQGYRLRHALHKADPDQQRAHRRHPWITIFDDHEVANNTWAEGAQNHTASEGDFLARRREAYEAYLEWMPFRLPEQRRVPHRGTRFFKRFTFGDLGDLSILETRQNHSAQIDVAPYTKIGGGFIPTGIPAVDARLADPSRHLAEPEQLGWLKKGLSSRRGGWHLIGNQVILAPVRFPGAVLGAPPNVSLLNSDQWDGYQADQAELIAHLDAQTRRAGDAVVLTGDIHSSWAMDIPARRSATGYKPAGVEFVCPSVSSDGFYEVVRAAQPAGTPVANVVATTRGITAAITAANPWIRYLDGIGHGYTLIDVTPERVQADYFLTAVPTSAQPDPRVDATVEPVYNRSWQTLAGSRQVSTATGPVGDRSDSPHGPTRR